MDLAQGNVEPGNRIVQYTCHGGPNQRFKPQVVAYENGNEVITISPKGWDGYFCLDVLGHNWEYGAPLGLWTCNNAPNQRFIMEVV